MIVVDSNVLAARNLTGARTPLAERVALRDSLWIAPPLWRYEFQNILAKSIWAKQLTFDGARHVWQVVMTRMADNEREPSPERVLDLSHNCRITAYDANFIALAVEMGVPCVTEDVELHAKFPAIALGMGAFLSSNWSAREMRETRAPYATRRRREKAAP